MEIFGRYNDGPQPKCSSAVADYVGGHLAPPLESGDLKGVPGYLSQDGTITPLVAHPELWKEVGWNPQVHPLPPANLIQGLTQGFDGARGKLAGRGLFRSPKEALFSIPAELSVALMEFSPTERFGVMADLFNCWAEERDKVAVRIMIDGERKWEQGKTLSLGFIHLKDRSGAPSLHLHDYTFCVAKDGTGTWRSYDNGKASHEMPKIRAKLTDTVIASCARLGIRIDWARGLARERDGESQGVTVYLPSGRVIVAGSLDRARRSDILAAQSIRETLGVPALTPRELELVRRETGKFPCELKGVRRRDLLVAKLNALGLLDGEGRILPREDVDARLPGIAEGLEAAAEKLRAIPLPGPRAAAVEKIVDKISSITRLVPDLIGKVEAARDKGKLRWTAEYQRVMGLVERAGTLGTGGLPKQDRDLLSKLKKSGLLEGTKVDGRMTYRVSELGLSRVPATSLVSAHGSARRLSNPQGAGPSLSKGYQARVKTQIQSALFPVGVGRKNRIPESDHEGQIQPTSTECHQKREHDHERKQERDLVLHTLFGFFCEANSGASVDEFGWSGWEPKRPRIGIGTPSRPWDFPAKAVWGRRDGAGRNLAILPAPGSIPRAGSWSRPEFTGASGLWGSLPRPSLERQQGFHGLVDQLDAPRRLAAPGSGNESFVAGEGPLPPRFSLAVGGLESGVVENLAPRAPNLAGRPTQPSQRPTSNTNTRSKPGAPGTRR